MATKKTEKPVPALTAKKRVVKKNKPLPAGELKAAKPAKTKKAAKPAAPKPAVKIDHPVTGEIIACRHYTVRISTTAPGRAEISVSGGAWLPCRDAVGFRWFDWYPAESGGYVLCARIFDAQDAVVCESGQVAVEVK